MISGGISAAKRIDRFDPLGEAEHDERDEERCDDGHGRLQARHPYGLDQSDQGAEHEGGERAGCAGLERQGETGCEHSEADGADDGAERRRLLQDVDDLAGRVRDGDCGRRDPVDRGVELGDLIETQIAVRERRELDARGVGRARLHPERRREDDDLCVVDAALLCDCHEALANSFDRLAGDGHRLADVDEQISLAGDAVEVTFRRGHLGDCARSVEGGCG